MENLDRKALEDLFDDELAEIQDQAVFYFQRFINQQGIVLTGDLREKLHTTTVKIASQLYCEIMVKFSFYGRFKDLKYSEYKPGTHPDPDGTLVQGMKAMIEKKGLNAFYGIPGYYGSSSLPVSSVSINRLAYGLAQARINKGIIRKKGEGWYTKGRSFFVKETRATLQKRISEYLIREVAQSMNITIHG